MGGGGLFTGNIDLECTINLLIVMVVFACVRSPAPCAIAWRCRGGLSAQRLWTDLRGHLRQRRAPGASSSAPAAPVPPAARSPRPDGGAACPRQLANNRGHSEMLSKVYKELMILGFIAFVVAMAQELGLHVSAADIKCFHFADMLLSCAVIL